jgi:hypothetical protein
VRSGNTSGLIGWEEDDYSQTNKRLVEYGNKYKNMIFNQNREVFII